MALVVIDTVPAAVIDDSGSSVTRAFVVVLPNASASPGLSALGAKPGPPTPSVVITYFSTFASLSNWLLESLLIVTLPAALRLLPVISTWLLAWEKPKAVARLGHQFGVSACHRLAPLMVISLRSKAALALDVIESALFPPWA